MQYLGIDVLYFIWQPYFLRSLSLSTCLFLEKLNLICALWHNDVFFYKKNIAFCRQQILIQIMALFLPIVWP